MGDEKTNERSTSQLPTVGVGYAKFQIAKALRTLEGHPDGEARDRAEERVKRWETVFRNILTGAVAYGSRAPLSGTPVWATPEVVTGGFATGSLLAGGPLQQHEIKILEALPRTVDGDGRKLLNSHFLSEGGFARLSEFLANRQYDIGIPEEGALLIVAWLAENECQESARRVVDQIGPYFDQLRFYPIPREVPRHPVGFEVHLQTVKQVVSNLGSLRPNERILAQKESVNVWAPLHDHVAALFLETIDDGWPCRRYAEDWSSRARDIVHQYDELRSRHKLSRKPDRPNQHYYQLRELLRKCAYQPKSLTDRDVGQIRLILAKYQEKHGAPGSDECLASRRRQMDDVAAPTFHAISEAVLPRLSLLPQNDGCADIDHFTGPVTQEEAYVSGVPFGTLLPRRILRRMERCRSASIQALIHRNLITSGDTLATLLPQLTSALLSASFNDPRLQDLYAAIYQAFRRRRSLLLLNLEKQVQFEELPWIQAIEPLRSQILNVQDQSRKGLEELAVLTLNSFPQAIIPNKLLQEMKALAEGAKLDIPLLEEVAADIFMGKFSDKFLEAAKRAGTLIGGTLYTTYYGIDYPAVEAMNPGPDHPFLKLFRSHATDENAFANFCAKRANVDLGGGAPATNGMIIEQQQIVTTQNLAVLFDELGLTDRLREDLPGMVRKCFEWICRRLQTRARDWHSRMVAIKNTAYAWRQMLFFLSCMGDGDVDLFMRWAEVHLAKQSEAFQLHFRPAINGLIAAVAGRAFEDESRIRHFFGWSKEHHWLLREGPEHSRMA